MSGRTTWDLSFLVDRDLRILEGRGACNELLGESLQSLIGQSLTGIVVAAVARLNCLAIIPVAILIAGLSNAGSSLQILGIPSDIVVLLQGVVLLLVAASEFFLYNRIRMEWPWRSSPQPRA